MARKKTSRTLFTKPRSKKLANIITFRNPDVARGAVKELSCEFRGAKTDAKKERIRKATQQAANRADASSKRKNLSTRERRELKQISSIYNRAAKSFKKKTKK